MESAAFLAVWLEAGQAGLLALLHLVHQPQWQDLQQLEGGALLLGFLRGGVEVLRDRGGARQEQEGVGEVLEQGRVVSECDQEEEKLPGELEAQFRKLEKENSTRQRPKSEERDEGGQNFV